MPFRFKKERRAVSIPDESLSPWSLSTRLVHGGERGPAPVATPTATPIYTTATYLYEHVADLDAAFESGQGYTYARSSGNPTVGVLEQVMATAEGGVGGVAFASGMAALHAAVLAAGTPQGSTHPQLRGILAARDLYGATTTMLQEFFAQQGVAVTACDMCEIEAVEAA